MDMSALLAWRWSGIEIAAAAAAIATITVAVALLARLTAPLFEALRTHLPSPPDPRFTRRCVRLLAAALASFGLLLATYIRPWSDLPLLLLAIGLGLAVGTTCYRAERLLNISRPVSLLFAVAIMVATVAGTLGGLKPLTLALDQASFNLGSHRISALNVITTVLVAAALFAIVRLTVRIVDRSIARSPSLDPLQRVLAQKLVGIGIVVIAVILGIDLLGIDLTSLAVFSGALGLAVGFGLQKTLGNLIAGLILLMDRSIKPGDIIAVGGSFGWVNKIGIRAVSVVTRDGKEHLIPNENLMTQEVENWSFSSRDVRIHVAVGVSYEADLRKAQDLMLEAARAVPRVLKTPEPVVWLKAFGDRAVEFDLRVWISDPEGGIGNVQGDILMRIWDMFREHGIGLPYPQRDIHIRTMPAGVELPIKP